MTLEQIVDNKRTDKNTTHSYLPLYESLFKNKKETAQNILEIGIQNGGSSIKLWRDYFINATIYHTLPGQTEGLKVGCGGMGVWVGVRNGWIGGQREK
jgi:hypothetical protein